MRWVRLAAGMAFWLVLALVIAFLTGAGGRPWGWILVAVLLAVVPSQIALTLGGRAAAAVAVVLGSLLSAAVVALTPLPASRLDGVAAGLVLPATWHRSARAVSGGPFCRPHCPAVTIGFEVDAEPSIALRSLVDALRARGFEARVSPRPGETIVGGRSGRVTMRARVAPVAATRAALGAPAAALPPLGQSRDQAAPPPPASLVTVRLSSSPGNGELPVLDL